MMAFQRTTVGLVALILVGGIACQDGTTSPATPAGDNTSTPDDGAPKVALVMKSLANEFFQTMEDGARAHQQQNPTRYELIAEGIKNELDVARQIDLVDRWWRVAPKRWCWRRPTRRHWWRRRTKPSKPG